MFRYRTDSATYYDSATSKALTASQLRDIRDALADGLEAEITDLVARFQSGEITITEWAVKFADLIRSGMTAGYALGHGGVHTLDTEAMAKIDALIRDQTSFAERFIRDLGTTEMSPEQMTARAQLYAGQAVRAYEEARGAANGIELPVYPGDGGTPCLGRCRCYWSIESDDTTVTATWVTSSDDRVCEGCFQRGQDFQMVTQARTWM